MGIIYLISNVINNKLYVGLTTESLNERWNHHKSDFNRFLKNLKEGVTLTSKRFCVKLCRAFNKYDLKNFKIEILDTEDDIAILKKLETEYIKQLDTIKNGYNIQDGGEHQSHSEKTKKIIGVRTSIGMHKNINIFRKNENVKDLPPRCIWIKQNQGFAINRHPNCKYKLFTIKKYGSEELAKEALLKFYNNLPNEIIEDITYSDSE